MDYFFLTYKNLGELGPGGLPGPGQASELKERLQRYLQIAHQQDYKILTSAGFELTIT